MTDGMAFNLRRMEVTVRSTVDFLIVMTILKHDLVLLHDDKDFDQVVAYISGLRVLNQLL